MIFPKNLWMRYADDDLIHCAMKKQVIHFRKELAKRIKEYFLENYPEKSKIVYCRIISQMKKVVLSFGVIPLEIDWVFISSALFSHIRLLNILNPIIRGWVNYFMKFNKSEASRKENQLYESGTDKMVKSKYKSDTKKMYEMKDVKIIEATSYLTIFNY